MSCGQECSKKEVTVHFTKAHFIEDTSYIGVIERKQLISMEHSSREKSKCTPRTFKFVLVYKADCIHTWNTSRFY